MNRYTSAQLVRVTTPGRLPAEGIILAARKPGKLPAIAGAPDVAKIAAILAEINVRQVLIIEIGKAYIFAALVIDRDNIVDLRGQQLSIEVMKP